MQFHIEVIKIVEWINCDKYFGLNRYLYRSVLENTWRLNRIYSPMYQLQIYETNDNYCAEIETNQRICMMNV